MEALGFSQAPRGPPGRRQSETTFDAGVLRYKRQYRVKEFDVPVSGLPELNKAFSAILADERSSAVFKAK